MGKPLVSICLITYMHERYIEDCLKSLVGQTYDNIELLILDDASTDNTFQIIKTYEVRLRSRFPRILIEQNSHNSGNVSANFNHMLKQTNGEYVKTFSGDDVMALGYVEKMVEHMEKNSDAIMGYTNAYAVEDGFRMGDDPGNEYAYTKHKPCSQAETFERLMISNYLIAPTTMMRKRAFEKYGYYDETISFEDYEFWLRLSRYENFTYLPRKLIYYRRAENSMTNYKSGDVREKLKHMMPEEKKIYDKYLKYVPYKKRRIFQQCFYEQYLVRALRAHIWGTALQMLFFMKRKKYPVKKEVFRGLFSQNGKLLY